MQHYDAIVIGAGQAGPGIAAGYAGEGKRVALVEADRVGGTCLNYGCRPTKAMRASARAAHVARHAERYGVRTGEVTVDFAAVMARKDRIIDGMREGFVSWLEGAENIDLIRAEARFLGRNGDGFRVAAGDAELVAPQVFLDPGHRPNVPPIDGIDDVPHLTSETLMGLRELPRKLVIVGGGFIGLEFGQMFRRFGSQVTIVQSGPQLAPRADADVAEAVQDLLEKEGVEVRLEAKAVAVEGEAGDLTITCENGSTFQASHLLLAAGRRSNADRLNLDAIGLETDERGTIPVDGALRTAVDGVWALGDVNGRGAFTHTAVQDYEIAWNRLRGGERSVDGRTPTYAVFVDPPLGHVGMTEAEARASDRSVLKSAIPMSDVSRAKLEEETDGLIKVLVDADSERFLGCTVFGIQGDDIVQIVGALMEADAPYTALRDALPVHPTVAEFFPTILRGLEPLGG